MRIIATIPKNSGRDDVLVQMTHEEVAKVTGLNYEHQLNSSDVLPGRTFDVSSAWDLISKHRRAQGELASVSRTLRALADLCDQRAPGLLVPTDPKPEAPPTSA